MKVEGKFVTITMKEVEDCAMTYEEGGRKIRNHYNVSEKIPRNRNAMSLSSRRNMQ